MRCLTYLIWQMEKGPVHLLELHLHVKIHKVAMASQLGKAATDRRFVATATQAD